MYAAAMLRPLRFMNVVGRTNTIRCEASWTMARKSRKFSLKFETNLCTPNLGNIRRDCRGVGPLETKQTNCVNRKR